MLPEERGIAHAVHCMELLHHEQPALLSQLITAVRGYAQGTETAREIDEQLAVLVEHMRMCFLDEEGCMDASGLVNRDLHRAQHRLALWRARSAMHHWLQGRNTTVLLRYLDDSLPAWRSEHYSAMDAPDATLMCDVIGEALPGAATNTAS